MSMQNRIRLLAALVLALGLDTAHAATFNVTRADDPVPDSCLAGDCSLREAIAATATTPEADTIVLGAGQYRVTRGELAIDGAMTIAAAGSAATRITSSGDYTILHVLPFGALTIQGTEIGTVASVEDFGAGDVIEIARPGERPLLIAFNDETVPEVDLDGGRIVVVPPEEFGEPEKSA